MFLTCYILRRVNGLPDIRRDFILDGGLWVWRRCLGRISDGQGRAVIKIQR